MTIEVKERYNPNVGMMVDIHIEPNTTITELIAELMKYRSDARVYLPAFIYLERENLLTTTPGAVHAWRG